MRYQRGSPAARMPAFQPAARPLFGCCTSVASGKRSRTASTVPSVEPLSTTTVGSPRTLSRQRSTHGSAFHVTTTAATSAMAHTRTDTAARAFPDEDDASRKRQRDRHQEEEEAGGERRVGVDA